MSLETLRNQLENASRADLILAALLDFTGDVAAHGLLLAVSQQVVRLYEARGFPNPSTRVRQPVIKVIPNSYLAEVCQGTTYYQGPIDETELAGCFLDLLGASPVEVVILPIQLGQRTPLLLVVDNGSLPIHEVDLQPIFQAVHMVASALGLALSHPPQTEPEPEPERGPEPEPVSESTPPASARRKRVTRPRGVSSPALGLRSTSRARAETEVPQTSPAFTRNLATRPRVGSPSNDAQRPTTHPQAQSPSSAEASSEDPSLISSDEEIQINIDDSTWDGSEEERWEWGDDENKIQLRTDKINLRTSRPLRNRQKQARSSPESSSVDAPPAAAARVSRRGRGRVNRDPDTALGFHRPANLVEALPEVEVDPEATLIEEEAPVELLDISDTIEPLRIDADEDASGNTTMLGNFLPRIEPEAIEPLVGHGAAWVEIDYEYWLERLDDPDPETALQAWNHMTQPKQEVLDLLLAAFPGKVQINRFQISRDVPPASQHSRVLAALVVLSDMAAPALTQRLSSRSADDRFYAMLFFLETDSLLLRPHLRARLFDRDPQVQKLSIQAVKSNLSPDLLEHVREVCQQAMSAARNPRDAEVGARTLGALRDIPSLPPLLTALQHPQRRVVEAAHDALVAITLEDQGTSLKRWQRWLRQHGESLRDRTERIREGMLHRERTVRHHVANELSEFPGLIINFHPDASRRDRVRAQEQFAEWLDRRNASQFPGGSQS